MEIVLNGTEALENERPASAGGERALSKQLELCQGVTYSLFK